MRARLLYLAVGLTLWGCSANQETNSIPSSAQTDGARATPSKPTKTEDGVHRVTVGPDGAFSPAKLTIADGDTVQWVFHDRNDTIIPVAKRPGAAVCSAYKRYDSRDPNEFTGPLPRAASGIFALGPQANRDRRRGSVVETKGSSKPSCKLRQSIGRAGKKYLCPTGEPYMTMDSTWKSPDITGVFIRPWWNDVHVGPGQFDWTAVDREIAKAVKHGKLYSLSFKAGSKGTPRWIFDPKIAHPVKKLTFQDGDSDGSAGCGSTLHLGSPTDPNYKKHYFAMLSAAAAHIKQRNAWYRSLAYVKPSGANLFTSENRLPKRCEQGCICNPEVWARDGGYTPKGLYQFYSEQTAVLAKEFPHKDMAYMLIQAGFPLVSDKGQYRPGGSLPKPTEQTEQIIAQGKREHGLRFIVQHNGLGPKPQDRGQPGLAKCPNEGLHPARRPFGPSGSGCPNPWVLRAGADGQITAFQTNNQKKVRNPADLDSTLRNAWDNSDGIFVEIYEERLWEVQQLGPTGATLAAWTERFHERRRAMQHRPDPFPLSHSHTFKHTAKQGAQQLFYVHGTKCHQARGKRYGQITVSPKP